MSCINKLAKFFHSSKSIIENSEINLPIAVIRVEHVLKHWTDPDGRESERFDVIERLNNPLEIASAAIKKGEIQRRFV
jgi:hypothetical protein